MIGLRLHNYEVVSLLGEGGMGQVYLARHVFMGRRAAIKFLRPELLANETVVARFLDESRATNAIGHPNIIDIIDVGLLSDGRTPYLMMECLNGESLATRIARSRPLPIHEAVEIACQTASGLGAAHARQIVHRDLKPDNLFLVPDEALPSKVRVKVLDFGIAKLRGDMRGGSVRTQTGAVMGTAQYMSPEQCLGRTESIDHRTDIYALGIILYEMLSGQVPFISEGLGETMLLHMSTPPAPLRERVPEIPESLERAVMRALAKDPAHRFQSMADLALAVREFDPRAAMTAHVGGRSPNDNTPQVAATVFIPDGTPAPVLIPATSTPAPVRVPAGLTPPPTPLPAPVWPGLARPRTEIDSAPHVAMPPSEPGWTPRANNAGAHTTLAGHAGQVLATKRGVPKPQRPRALLATITLAAAAAIALASMAVLRGRGKENIVRPVPVAAEPAMVPTPAPDLALVPPAAPPHEEVKREPAAPAPARKKSVKRKRTTVTSPGSKEGELEW